MRAKTRAWLTGAALLHLAAGAPLGAVEYGNRLGSRLGEELFFRSAGVPIYAGTLDPAVHRWYMPPTQFAEYGRRQWQYTNWGTDSYLRYVAPGQEGDYFYDLYGNLASKGWLIYDWRQTQPLLSQSSNIVRQGQYLGWFDRLLISSDRRGDTSFSILIGDEISALLTPMTLRKAGFNGVVTSMQSGPYRATGLFSRINVPMLGSGAGRVRNTTALAGGRVEVDVHDALILGFNFVNSHNNSGTYETMQGNPLKGFLSPEQASRGVNTLAVRISDDSPEDGEGGAVLISSDIEISTTLMREVPAGDGVAVVPIDTVIVGSDIGFEAIPGLQFVTGEVGIGEGRLVEGFRTADGGDVIVLNYLLELPPQIVAEERVAQLEPLTLRSLLGTALGLTPTETEEAIAAIDNLRIRLIVANDYAIAVTSDRQTDEEGVPQFRTVTRAAGNVRNRLNQREVVFDYGLPTANNIVGVTAEIRDYHGFDFYGEVNLNNQYRKYPGVTRSQHRAISGLPGHERAVGWMVNASWRGGPLSLFAEGFGMDDDYTTSVLLMDLGGLPNYGTGATNLLYDYVDDNDDNDRHPDQRRFGQGSLVPVRASRVRSIDVSGVADPEVFPGYDENRDFIPDFNQNTTPERPNFFPDYDEPFLRFRSDRPQFLFGMDLNNNGWVERFENDDEPDYPYKKDHFGYNLFGGVEITPEIELKLGQLREEMGRSSRGNRTSYGLLTLDRNTPRAGRIRVFEMLRKAEDTIPDNLVQWRMRRTLLGNPTASSGRMEPVLDPLAAEDTWISVFYADWEVAGQRPWRSMSRLKWETWRQRDSDPQVNLDAAGDTLSVFDPLGPEGRNGRRESGFFGLINKIEYLQRYGRVELSPRFKSEFLRETPFSLTGRKRRSWDRIFFLLVEFPVLKRSRLKAGLEQRFFEELASGEEELPAGAVSGDFRGTAAALQLTNVSEFLGYRLTMQTGLRVDRRSLEVVAEERRATTAGLAYLTLFAALR